MFAALRPCSLRAVAMDAPGSRPFCPAPAKRARLASSPSSSEREPVAANVKSEEPADAWDAWEQVKEEPATWEPAEVKEEPEATVHQSAKPEWDDEWGQDWECHNTEVKAEMPEVGEAHGTEVKAEMLEAGKAGEAEVGGDHVPKVQKQRQKLPKVPLSQEIGMDMAAFAPKEAVRRFFNRYTNKPGTADDYFYRVKAGEATAGTIQAGSSRRPSTPESLRAALAPTGRALNRMLQRPSAETLMCWLRLPCWFRP